MVKKTYFLTAITVLLTAAMFLVSCGKDKNGNDIKDAKRFFERGTAYYKLGKIDKAIKEYEEAIFYNKEFKMAHYNLAVLYKEKGLYTDAVREFEEYLKYATNEDDEVVKKYVTEEIKRLKKKNR